MRKDCYTFNRRFRIQLFYLTMGKVKKEERKYNQYESHGILGKELNNSVS
jgi:hypothetical protein